MSRKGFPTDYMYRSGTSQAAPYVTGAASLIWSRFPTLNHSQVKRQILNTVEPLASLAGKTVTGGILSFCQGQADRNGNGIPDACETLVHSYTFNNGTAFDSGSVGGADGTLVGGATIDNGALVTTAQGQWMEMPGNVIAMNTFNEVTIEAWYTPTARANMGWTMLAYFGDSVNGFGSNGFNMTSARDDDKSRTAISIGDIATPWASETGADGPEYDDGLLHHMVSTIDDTDITLYIDGVLYDNTHLDPHNSISGISRNFAYLAKSGYDADPEWIGAIDEFNIYNVALSAQEVAANYTVGPVCPMSPSRPVAIDVKNASFELPGYFVNGFAGVPGWSSDTIVAQSGVESGMPATDGIWTVFLMASDPSIWQLTGHVIGANDVIELKVDAGNNWAATDMQISLYYDDNGARVTIASLNGKISGYVLKEFALTLNAANAPNAVGKRLGVELNNTSAGWVQMDNVRLSLIH